MTVIVIGAGPSGLHVALTALERGRPVTLVDVGNSAPSPPLADRAFPQLKTDLPDPVSYFLGKDYLGAEIPADIDESASEYYRLPPSKDHVFARPAQFGMQADGIAPLVSFAGGGLAECWTAGAYPFNEDDLSAFPFGYDDLAPHYATVARRIGIGGVADDLSRHFPPHDGLSDPVRLNPGSARLLAAYDARRARLHRRHAVRLGRSRQAALSHGLGDRKACFQCGRCLWGCPNGALYTPSLSLADCLKNPLFTYVPGRYASHFTLSDATTLEALVTYPSQGGAAEEMTAEAFVLACGTLNSSAIFLRTLWHSGRHVAPLRGLMDNRQLLAPFLNLGMLGRDYGAGESYQYHQLAVGLPGRIAAHYVHGQITMFTSGAAHPVIQQLPLGLRGASGVFAALRSALGVVNLNFHDDRRPGNIATLDPTNLDATGAPRLDLHYRPRQDEGVAIAEATSRMRRFFLDLGAPLIPGMARLRPMGASVHYAGTLPMSEARTELAVSPSGQSWDFGNLFVADGATFPFLPAKNLTLTLMALATRTAKGIF